MLNVYVLGYYRLTCEIVFHFLRMILEGPPGSGVHERADFLAFKHLLQVADHVHVEDIDG